jgi:hypothetical protein
VSTAAERDADAATLREALAGDGYGWLAARLGAPAPLRCPRCGTLMHPAAGLIVPACPQCYPGEVRRAGLRG